MFKKNLVNSDKELANKCSNENHPQQGPDANDTSNMLNGEIATKRSVDNHKIANYWQKNQKTTRKERIRRC